MFHVVCTKWAEKGSREVGLKLLHFLPSPGDLVRGQGGDPFARDQPVVPSEGWINRARWLLLMEPELRMNLNTNGELRASLFISRDWLMAAVAGTFPYNFEAPMHIDMMCIWVCIYAHSASSTKPKDTAQHQHDAEPQLTHVASCGCWIPWPQQLQQKEASTANPAPSPQTSSQPCSAHTLPGLLVDGTQDGLGAAIKVMSVGVHRQLQ